MNNFFVKARRLPLILASTSLWRKRLLQKHGYRVKSCESGFKEMKGGKDPKKLVLFNARGKAMAVFEQYPTAIIVGVDTVGWFKGKVLEKPKGRREAARMLSGLFGHTHQVITGLCVIRGAQKIMHAETTRVTFRKVSPLELEAYLDSGEWKGKAGSYAIQGRAKKFVEKIDGELTNVVGLPVKVLEKMLMVACASCDISP